MRRNPLVALSALWLVGLVALWFGFARAPDVSGADRANADESNSTAVALDGGDATTPATSSSAREAIVLGPTPEELAAAEAAAKRAAERRVEGRVVNPEGVGVAGASVWITTHENWMKLPLDIEPEGLPKSWLDVKKLDCDGEGRFSVEGLKPGPLRIAARADGFAPTYLDHLNLPEYDQHAVGDVKLERGVSVSGRVLGPDGQGLAGVQVLIAMDCAYRSNTLVMPGRGVPVGVSGADGAFSVSQLAAGAWHLIFETPGCMAAEADGRIERAGGSETGIVVRLRTGYDIQGKLVAKDVPMPVGVRIHARPLAPETEGEDTPASPSMFSGGPPVAAPPKETVRPRTALVQDDGTFSLDGLKPDTKYRLTATKRAENGEFKPFPAVEARVVLAGTRNVELLVKPESVLVFRVVDDSTGLPIEEMVVATGIGRERALRDDKNEVRTKFVDGRVRYADLRIPTNNTKAIPLRVRANGYKDHVNKGVGLRTGQELDLGEIRLVREHVAVVTVIDRETKAPVVGARVLLSGVKNDEELSDLAENGPEVKLLGFKDVEVAVTGEDGVARVTSAPGKTAGILASAKGYRPCQVVRSFLPTGADHAVTLELGRGGTVIARVTDGAGHVVAGVGVSHRLPRRNLDDENVDGAKKSDPKGEVRFEALANGQHGFRLYEEDGDVYFWGNDDESSTETPWIEVGVVEGQTITVELVAPARGDVHGIVREAGRPVEGAHIKFVPRKPGEEKQGMAYWSNGNDPFSTVTRHDGSYKLEHLRTGEYSALVLVPGRRMATEFRLRVTPDDSQHDFQVDISGIEGRVVGEDGRPIAGLDVYCWRTKGGLDIDQPYRMVVTEDDRGNPNVEWEQITNGSIRTDDAGRYSIPGLVCNEPLVVSVQGAWVESQQSPEISLSSGEVRHGVDFKLRLAGQVEITLAGANVPRDTWFLVQVTATAEKDGGRSMQTYVGSWNRSNTLGSVLPGRYKVTVTRHGDETGAILHTSEIDVTVGATAKVSFDPSR